MIKLFRKTRKNLLMENKTSKYFKYAIGEIALVVVGILIALQINNWNENRKANTEEVVVLNNLFENLTLAKQQSEVLILEEKELKKSLMFVLGIDSIQDKKSVTDSIFESAVWDLQTDSPTVNAYINLKNTNKLSLIKSKKINEKFSGFEFSINKLKDLLEDRLNVHQIRIDAIFENDINFIPLIKYNIPNISIEKENPNEYSKILNQKRIRNLLGMKLSFTQDVLIYRENLDTEIKDLLLLIASDLNSKQ
jgi:hypothetical protein